jgi:predicted phage-related endonuclease
VTINLLNPTEAEALELEALVSVDSNTDIKAKIRQARSLKEKRDAAEKAYSDAKNELGSMLADAGLQGFTLNGKVVVRRSLVRTSRLDSKALKAKHPRIFAAFMKVTESIRVTVD